MSNLLEPRKQAVLDAANATTNVISPVSAPAVAASMITGEMLAPKELSRASGTIDQVVPDHLESMTEAQLLAGLDMAMSGRENYQACYYLRTLTKWVPSWTLERLEERYPFSRSKIGYLLNVADAYPVSERVWERAQWTVVRTSVELASVIRKRARQQGKNDIIEYEPGRYRPISPHDVLRVLIQGRAAGESLRDRHDAEVYCVSRLLPQVTPKSRPPLPTPAQARTLRARPEREDVAIPVIDFGDSVPPSRLRKIGKDSALPGADASLSVWRFTADKGFQLVVAGDQDSAMRLVGLRESDFDDKFQIAGELSGIRPGRYQLLPME